MSNEVVTQLDEVARRDIAEYLDKAIRIARRQVAETAGGDELENLKARCYVDAFQSVRTSLLGEVLPKEE